MRTEFDWKLDTPLGWNALSLNEDDEAFRVDVHFGKMDAISGINTLQFSGLLIVSVKFGSF